MLFLDCATPVTIEDPICPIEYDVNTHRSYFSADYIAAELFTIGSKLTNPVCWCSSYVHRILSPFPHDIRGDALVEEMISKGVNIVKLSLLAPVSVPLAGAGIGFRYVASNFIPKGFCLLPGGNSSEQKLSNKTLSVMSWNICGLAGSMDRSHGGVRDWSERFNEITQILKEQNPDILCLQEVHDTDLADRLFHSLYCNYAYFYLHTGPRSMGSNSGNFIASKYPLYCFSFSSFEASTGSNKWQNKGFVQFLVGIDKKPLLAIVATHFQHGDILDEKADIVGVRNSQLKQILKSTQGWMGKYPILLVGDLNIDKGTEEYKESLLSSYFSHGYMQDKPTSTDQLIKLTWDDQYIADNCLDETIDYISFLNRDPFTKKPLKHPFLSVQMLEVFDNKSPNQALSDHHALIGKITFKKID